MAAEAFQYTVLRVVPSVEREEFVNAGVIVFCRTRGYLAARIALDARRLEALAPDLDLEMLRAHLEARVRIAAGEPGAGPIAALPRSERFHWLAAPASTIIQASPVHSGVCEDPEVLLEHLMARLVNPVTRPASI